MDADTRDWSDATDADTIKTGLTVVMIELGVIIGLLCGILFRLTFA